MLQLDEESSSLSPLPAFLYRGLLAVSTLALLSFLTSSILFLYLTYRLITWRWKNGFSQTTNQFLILIYNLLIADIQQAVAFLLNIHTLRHGEIQVETTNCWAQGWFISTGDLASSIMITAIGLHTFFSVVKGYRPSTKVFWIALASCWVFVYLLGALGPLMYGEDFYVRAGAWCWINHKYGSERLWLHYFWMFFCIFTCIATYACLFIYLRTAKGRSSPMSTQASEGAAPLMVLYPLIYTVCTTPLAAGRIYALQGHHVGLTYFCVAAAMIASNGWLDVLLYASTRREIVFSEFPPGEETGLETFAFMGKGHKLGTVTTIQGNANPKGRRHERTESGRIRRSSERQGESVENLYALGEITVKGEVSVKIEDSNRDLIRRDRIVSGDSLGEERDWDSRSVKSGKSILMNRP